MPFVMVPHRDDQPSMQAIELSQRIQQTIAEYQQRNPSLTAEEVRQAALLAARQAGASATSGRPVAALVAAGAAALVLGAGLWASSNPGSSGVTMVPLAIIAALAAVMVAVLRRRG